MTRKQKWIAAAVAVLTLASILAVWAFWIEPRRLLLHEETLVLPDWPAGSSVKLAVLSDLHVGSPHHGVAKLREIIDRVNAERPDAVLVLGDLVIQGVLGGQFVTPETIANELQRLQSSAGTFAVLGNHDWWLDGMRVRSALSKAAIRVLEDSAQNVATEQANFWLAGVSDYWEARHDVARALREVPKGAPVIVFTHNPDIFPSIPGIG